MPEPIRILLADDHPIVRQGLRAFLDIQDDMVVVAEAADGVQALELLEQHRPDVLLLDLKMPGLDGQQVLGELAERDAGIRVIVLTSVTSAHEVAPAVRAGAAGFLYKDVDPDALAQAIRSVHDGQMLFAPQAASAMVNIPDREANPSLTDRERQVLDLLAMGRSNREIARSLVVTEKTVKTHVSAVLRKLGVADRTQAALWSVRRDSPEDG